MELFIEKVQNNPCLWHKNHVAYRDMARTDSAWERIARDCGMGNGREAKNQWKKLRDCHREALRRRSVEQGGQNLKPWKYDEAMKFLLPQFENKESIPNCINEYNETQDRTHESNAFSPAPSQDSPFPTTSYTSEFAKKAKYNNSDTLDEREIALSMNRAPRDGLTSLFECLCQKTRNLPKYLQLQVQREVFESVTRAEEEALSLESMSAHHSPVSYTSSYGYNNTRSQQQCSIPDVKPNINIVPETETLQ